MENIIQISKKQPVYNYECLVTFAIDHSNKHRRTLLSKKTVELLCKFVITSKYAVSVLKNKLYVWNNEHNTLKNNVAVFKENKIEIRSFSICEDATVMAAVLFEQGGISFFDLANLKFMYTLTDQQHMIQMHMSNTGRHLIYTGYDRTVIYDIFNRKDIIVNHFNMPHVPYHALADPIGHVIAIRENDDGNLVTIRGCYESLKLATTCTKTLETTSTKVVVEDKTNMLPIDAKITRDCKYAVILTSDRNRWVIRIDIATATAINYYKDAWNPSEIKFFGGCRHRTHMMFVLNDSRTVVLTHEGDDRQYTVITHGDVVTGRLSSIQRYKREEIPFPLVNNAEKTAFLQMKKIIKTVKETAYEYVEDYKDFYYRRVGSDVSFEDYLYSPCSDLMLTGCVVFERL
jgi:hypothetical protein